jgi:hypothetical protein
MSGGKRSGSAAAQQPPAKKGRRTEPKMTTEEIRQLIPNELKEYIRDSKVFALHSCHQRY